MEKLAIVVHSILLDYTTVGWGGGLRGVLHHAAGAGYPPTEAADRPHLCLSRAS
jgi:hypothetical protein